MEWPRTAIIRFKISAPSGTSLTLNLSRSGNQNVVSGFFLSLEIQFFPVAEDWHSSTASTGWLRSATGTNARILANPAPLRNCIRNTKRQQWRTDSPKKLTTLPYSKVVNSFLSHCHSANANQLKLTMDWQTVPIQCHCRLYVLEWKSCHLANEEPMLELFTNNLKLIATRLPLYPNLT